MKSNLAELQRKRLLTLIEAAGSTVAGVGNELGDKDYLRDFFTGRKNSLKPEAILKLEQIFRLRAGSLMDKKFLANEAGAPLAPESEQPNSEAARNLDQQAVRVIVEETIGLAEDLWFPDKIPEHERNVVTRLAINRASNRLALAPRPGSGQGRRPRKDDASSL